MGQSLGQFDRLRVGVAPQREERQLGGLCGRHRGKVGPAVPHLHHEQPSEPVEVTAAGVVEDAHALAANDHRHVGALVVDGVTGEVHPQVASGAVGKGVVAGLGDELRGGAHRVPQV